MIRAPNGVVKDGLDYWSVGKPMWDPAKLTMPTMLTLRGRSTMRSTALPLEAVV